LGFQNNFLAVIMGIWTIKMQHLAVMLTLLCIIHSAYLKKEDHAHGGHKQSGDKHYKDGEHDDDFDHEAVLGKLVNYLIPAH
jgi:hypothetical protein